MTKKDKLFFANFIIWTPLYAWPVNENTITSFVWGYEIGRGKKCGFIDLMCSRLSKKLKVKENALGWSDLITKHAQKNSLSWVVAFKKESIETLASEEAGGMDKDLKKIFKRRVLYLISNIGEDANYCFNQDWIDHWSIFCSSKNDWFKEFWTEEEYKAIKMIGRLINKADFKNAQPLKASSELLKQKAKFERSSDAVK